MTPDFERFFSTAFDVIRGGKDTEIAPEDVEVANAMLTFSSMSSYQRLLSWLEREADRPVPVRTDAVDMVASITRQNTMKEVRDQLRKWVVDAQEVMARKRGNDNG